MVQVLKVALERVDQLLLDVKHAAAHLAYGMVVIATGELVMRGSFAQVRGINRT